MNPILQTRWLLVATLMVMALSLVPTVNAQDSSVLLVSDLEAEINYNDVPLAQFGMTSCEAVTWSYAADWGDGKSTPSSKDLTTTHINDKGFRLRDRGAYKVWFSHVYDKANETPGYTVTLINAGQCAGYNYPDGVFKRPDKQQLKVIRQKNSWVSFGSGNLPRA